MSISTDVDDLIAEFNTQWGDTTPVAHMNFELDDEDVEEYVRFDVLPGTERPAEFGNTRWRSLGRTSCQIFVRPDIGNLRLFALVDLAAAVFRGRTVGGCTFRGGPIVSPLEEMGDWSRIAVQHTYYRDATYSIVA